MLKKVTMSKKKIAGIGASVLVAALVMNSWTLVQEGTVKVETLVGEINPTPLGKGIHLVNPLSSFDTYNVRNQKYEVTSLNIPTQDRFNSTGNVTVLFSVDGTKAPWIKANYGDADLFIETTLRQQLRSIIRDEGRKIADSRGLSKSDNVMAMQISTTDRLEESLGDKGVNVQEVLVQDITFDGRIAKQILATQMRIQQEESKASEEKISLDAAKIVSNAAKGKSDADKLAADAINYAILEKGKAEATAVRLMGEAIRDADIARAEGNIALSKTLTPAILKKQALDNQALLNEKSVGNVPQKVTILNSGDLQALGFPMGLAN